MRNAREFFLKALIVVMALGTLFGQVILVPDIAHETAVTYPEYGYVKAPYVALAIAALACIQVALVALWMLLDMASRDAVFGASAFRWVDVIIASALVATALTLVVAFHTTFVVQSGGPGVMVMLTAGVVGGLAFALLMVVMRGLLRKATAMHDELAEVV